jgi:hypothetical protein
MITDDNTGKDETKVTLTFITTVLFGLELVRFMQSLNVLGLILSPLVT